MKGEREQPATQAAAPVSDKPVGFTVAGSAVPIEWLRKYSHPKPIRRPGHGPKK